MSETTTKPNWEDYPRTIRQVLPGGLTEAGQARAAAFREAAEFMLKTEQAATHDMGGAVNDIGKYYEMGRRDSAWLARMEFERRAKGEA